MQVKKILEDKFMFENFQVEEIKLFLKKDAGYYIALFQVVIIYNPTEHSS